VGRKTTIEIGAGITAEQAIAALRAKGLISSGEETPAPAVKKPGTFEAEPLLTPAECAVIWKVDPKTITRWAKSGRLHAVRTLGGHRRYYAKEVAALLRGETWEPPGGWPGDSAPRKAA
jgi:excisionase family DNA binding protein